MRMTFNWRITLTEIDPHHERGYLHGWCYFGHGVDDSGRPKDMESARVAALLAAMAWDGYGDPAGFDKKVF